MGSRSKVIVIDTHIIIWDALKPELLSENSKLEIERANKKDGIIICDISLWEIAMLIQKGRLEIEIPYLEFISLIKNVNNYIIQPITPELAKLSTELPAEINKDPADRLIASASLINHCPLVTADKNLRKSSFLNTIW